MVGREGERWSWKETYGFILVWACIDTAGAIASYNTYSFSNQNAIIIYKWEMESENGNGNWKGRQEY